MDIEALRRLCLSFPGVTEQIQWGDDLLFKVGGKMFAATPLVPAPVCLSFKANPEKFFELTERQDIIPAPYLARAKWVALETRDAIPAAELAELLRESYEMVAAKLPRKVRESLAAHKGAKTVSLKALRAQKSHKSSAKKNRRK
jgi:predicted DNA-binding protein (MmcQ/YjbR family)